MAVKTRIITVLLIPLDCMNRGLRVPNVHPFILNIYILVLQYFNLQTLDRYKDSAAVK